MKHWVVVVGVVVVAGTLTTALPVKEKKHEEKEVEGEKEGGDKEHSDDWELNLEYGRYLKEVVHALESDPSFRDKLEKAGVDDIKSGKIARELHFVDHNIRTKLDELKRRELERLRHLAVKEHEKKAGVDRTLLKIPVHIDHKNPTRFEVEDLKKLIVKTTEDLEKVDNLRRSEFKQYELEKEYQRHQELQAMDEMHRKEAETQHDVEVKKHGDHPKLHHPGSKKQLEEVWEKQDHMQAEDFDPNTFFHLHDLDGNGYWDEMEVKALFKKELDKMYDPNNPEDDLTERFEEMERMREHVFKESDLDHDNLISFHEFVEQTKRVEFEQDNGWAGLDEQELYSQQEYENYERQRMAEIQQLVESGAIPPPPGYHGMPHVQSAVSQRGPHPNLATPQHYAQQQPLQVIAINQSHPQGYQALPQGYQAVPQGYQPVPQGYQAVPQGYQPVPQGYQVVMPEGYQVVGQGQQTLGGQVPQGYAAQPQQPHLQQGQPQIPQGQPQIPQGQPQVQQGYPQVQQGYPQVQQGQPQVQQRQPQVQQGQPQFQQGQPQVHQGQPQVQQVQPQVQQGQPQVQQGQNYIAQGQPQVPQGPGQVVQGVHPNMQQPITGHLPQPPQPINGQPGASH